MVRQEGVAKLEEQGFNREWEADLKNSRDKYGLGLGMRVDVFLFQNGERRAEQFYFVGLCQKYEIPSYFQDRGSQDQGVRVVGSVEQGCFLPLDRGVGHTDGDVRVERKDPSGSREVPAVLLDRAQADVA